MTNQNKKILVLGAGEMQIPIIKKVQELGYTSLVVDHDNNAPGFRYADMKFLTSTLNYEEVLKISKEYTIDGIITTSELPVRTVAYICEVLKLKGLSQYAADICTNKFKQREILAKKGYKKFIPSYDIVSNADDLMNKMIRLKFPLIIKPIDSSASRGVSKANSYDELVSAYKHAINYSNSKNVILEEFVEGNEYSVESLTQDGNTYIVAITEKKLYDTDGKSFVEERHIIPASLNVNQTIEVEAFVKTLCDIFSIDNCATHIEFKISNDRIILIEIGARLGGDYITSDLVPLSKGVDMLENIINISLGIPVKIKETKNNYAGVQFIDSTNHNVAEQYIKNNPEKIIKSEIKTNSNHIVMSSLDRLGYIITSAKSREELLNILEFGTK